MGFSLESNNLNHIAREIFDEFSFVEAELAVKAERYLSAYRAQYPYYTRPNDSILPSLPSWYMICRHFQVLIRS